MAADTPNRQDSDNSIDLHRLFESSNVKHLPEYVYSSPFKPKRLGIGKNFKLSCDFFSMKPIITRLHVAPSMKMKSDVQDKPKNYPSPPKLCVGPKPQKSIFDKKTTTKETEASKFRTWFNKRQEFRRELQKMGNSVKWLENKPRKSAFEWGILKKLEPGKFKKSRIYPDSERECDQMSVHDLKSENIKNTKVNLANNFALFRFFSLLDDLCQKKQPLVDIFAAADSKNKAKLSNDVFFNVLKEHIPVPDTVLNELKMMFNLCHPEINYRKFCREVDLFRKKNEMSFAGQHLQDEKENDQDFKPFDSGENIIVESENSAQSKAEQITTENKLMAPAPSKKDSFPDNIKNKLNVGQQPKMNYGRKTLQDVIDDHMQPTTLKGEMGRMYEERKAVLLQVYLEAVRMCQEQGIQLSPELLARALLFPVSFPYGFDKSQNNPDKTMHISCKSLFAAESGPHKSCSVQRKSKKTPKEKDFFLKVKRKLDVKNLSTSKSRGKVDCWMTFEEFKNILQRLPIPYKTLPGKTKSNSFWPFQLLNNLRLCMPPYDVIQQRNHQHPLFMVIPPKPR